MFFYLLLAYASHLLIFEIDDINDVTSKVVKKEIKEVPKNLNGFFENYDHIKKERGNLDNVCILKDYTGKYSCNEFLIKAFADFRCILKILADLSNKDLRKFIDFGDLELQRRFFKLTLRKITDRILRDMFLDPNIEKIQVILKNGGKKLSLKNGDDQVRKCYNYFVHSVFNLKEENINADAKWIYDFIENKNFYTADAALYNSVSIAYCNIIFELLKQFTNKL